MAQTPYKRPSGLVYSPSVTKDPIDSQYQIPFELDWTIPQAAKDPGTLRAAFP